MSPVAQPKKYPRVVTDPRIKNELEPELEIEEEAPTSGFGNAMKRALITIIGIALFCIIGTFGLAIYTNYPIGKLVEQMKEALPKLSSMSEGVAWLKANVSTKEDITASNKAVMEKLEVVLKRQDETEKMNIMALKDKAEFDKKNKEIQRAKAEAAALKKENEAFKKQIHEMKVVQELPPQETLQKDGEIGYRAVEPDVQEAHAEAVAVRDQQIAELTEKLQKMESQKPKGRKISDHPEYLALKRQLEKTIREKEVEKQNSAEAKQNTFATLDKRGEIITIIFNAITRNESNRRYDAISVENERKAGTPPRGKLAPGLKCEKFEYCDFAYGRYQVMGDNIPSWSKQYLGIELTPEEYLKNHDAQDIIARKQIAEYWDEYQDIRMVTASWHSSGPNYNSENEDAAGMSTKKYVTKIVSSIKAIREDLCRFPKHEKYWNNIKPGRV